MMNREFKKLASDVQMSEAFITSMFLALSGGFQDAYTYFTRDEVFSNAQTGNVVLMSTHLMPGSCSLFRNIVVSPDWEDIPCERIVRSLG